MKARVIPVVEQRAMSALHPIRLFRSGVGAYEGYVRFREAGCRSQRQVRSQDATARIDPYLTSR